MQYIDLHHFMLNDIEQKADKISMAHSLELRVPYPVSYTHLIKDHHNDLIIMGATGMNAVERMLMGSVTAYVNQHALSDVLRCV